jgi:hypothetical protein
MRLHIASSIFRSWFRGIKHKILPIKIIYPISRHEYNILPYFNYFHIKCRRCGLEYFYPCNYFDGMLVPKRRDEFVIQFQRNNMLFCDDAIIQDVHGL